MSKIEVGLPAPEFSAKNQNGETVSLASLRGRKVVLYFYPKDSTPGCTVEACSFRDYHGDFKERGVMILGVSPDSEKAHQKFIGEHQLPFDLLVDEGHKIAEAFGVWVEKSMYGKKYMGVERSTFVIDGEGKLEQIFRKVKPDAHVAEVLESL